MTECVTSKLPKWPFFLGDLILLGFASFIVYSSARPLGLWQMGFCLAALVAGAWISILPYLKEYAAGLNLAEAHTVADAMAQFENLKVIQTQMERVTGHWQTAQEQSSATVNAAKGIADRMKAETQDFMAFLEKANDTERAHLRLEVEKLRRTEGDWVQITVRILDHIYALNQAAARSGQPALISQLSQFQHACRDSARRVGLVAVTAAKGDAFEAKVHQPVDPQEKLPPDARIDETLATGYSYQGQLLRRVLVRIGPEPQPELPLLPQANETPAGQEKVSVEETEGAVSPTRAEGVAALA